MTVTRGGVIIWSCCVDPDLLPFESGAGAWPMQEQSNRTTHITARGLLFILHIVIVRQINMNSRPCALNSWSTQFEKPSLVSTR